MTRVASQEFGWTNSQPLDLLDGYDLLSGVGQRLVWQVSGVPYPKKLCRAICQGLVQSMKIDFVAAGLGNNFGNAAEDEEDEEMPSVEAASDEETEAEEPWSGDHWMVEGKDQVIRIHEVPRQALFTARVAGLPSTSRRTVAHLHGGGQADLEDDWTRPENAHRQLEKPWTGRTIFKLKAAVAEWDQSLVQPGTPAPSVAAPSTPAAAASSQPDPRERGQDSFSEDYGRWRRVRSYECFSSGRWKAWKT